MPENPDWQPEYVPREKANPEVDPREVQENFQQFLKRSAEEAWEAGRLRRIEEKLERLTLIAEGRLRHVPGIGWGQVL